MQPIPLREVVRRAQAHESAPAPIDSQLRLAAWLGLAGNTLFGAWLWFGSTNIANQPRSGFYMFGWGVIRALAELGGHAVLALRAAFVIVAAGLVLAAWTRGFHTGPAWAHWVTFSLAVSGAVAAVIVGVALAIVVANLAFWIVVVTAVTAFCMWMLFQLANSS